MRHLVVGGADFVSHFQNRVVSAADQFFDSAVVPASITDVGFGEEFPVCGKGRDARALAFKDAIAGVSSLLSFSLFRGPDPGKTGLRRMRIESRRNGTAAKSP